MMSSNLPSNLKKSKPSCIWAELSGIGANMIEIADSAYLYHVSLKRRSTKGISQSERCVYVDLRMDSHLEFIALRLL